MRSHDFDNEGLWRLTLSLSIPTCLSQAVNVLYAIVDRMFIGNIPLVGDVALAGVGVSAPITTLIGSFAVLIGLGGSPIMAMREGHREHEEAVRILSTGFVSLVAISFVIMPLCFLVKDPLLMLFGSSAATFPYADEYLTVYLMGTPFALLSTGMNSFLINQGMSRRAMVSVMAGALLNLVLDPIFIFTFDLGVAGAAAATVISQAASAAITLTSLCSRSARIRLTLQKPTRRILSRTVTLGLSPFIIIATDSMIMIVLNTVLQRYGGEGMGDALISASTIIQSFHLLVMNPLGGITGGSQGLLSYSYGAGRTDRVLGTWKRVQVLATLYTILMMVLAWSAGDLFIRLFTSDSALVALTDHYLKVFTAMIIPLSFQYNTVDTFTALGKAGISLPLSLWRKLCFTLCVFLFPFITKEAGSAFLSEPASDLIASLVSTTTLAIMLPRVLRQRQKGLGI